MKIGFDITTLGMPRTGIGQYQYNLIQHLLQIDSKNFYHLYAFNLRDNFKYEKLTFDAPFNNYEIKAHKIPQRLITAWWILSRFPRLEKITDTCDVYQVSEICQQPTKAKTVAFIHDLTTLFFPEHHIIKNRILYYFRNKRIKKYADAVLTNSEHTKKDLIEYLNIPAEKIFVTPFGTDKKFKPIKDTNKINLVLKKYNIHEPYICYLGTIEPRKNLNNLFEAFHQLKKQENIKHKLVLIGKDGWHFKKIYQKMHELKLENDIIKTGFVEDEDIPYLLNGAELFVYPSFYEGFGLPILEAMACGTPVVTSETSAMPEVGGDAALYVNPYKVEDIARKMLQMIQSKELRELYSQKGIEQAQKFSWKRCAEKTLQVYESLFY